ncbi:MAG TPA: hypothetical protein VF384_06680 [Planctomycetota bacterium]
MRSTGVAACVLLTCGLASGQQVVEIVHGGDVFAKFQEGPLASNGEVSAIERMVWICERLHRCEAAGLPKAGQLSIQVQQRRNLLVLQGAPEPVATVKQIIEQLRAEDPQRPTTLRLQCSLVTLPVDHAAAQDFQWSKVTPVDEVAMGKFVKTALAAKGTLQNLPEVLARPLVPFLGEASAVKQTDADRRLRFRGEILPLSAAEAVIALQLTRVQLPADRSRRPLETCLDEAFRLKVGSGMATAMRRQGEPGVTVLWVRLVGMDRARNEAGGSRK